MYAYSEMCNAYRNNGNMMERLSNINVNSFITQTTLSNMDVQRDSTLTYDELSALTNKFLRRNQSPLTDPYVNKEHNTQRKSPISIRKNIKSETNTKSDSSLIDTQSNMEQKSDTIKSCFLIKEKSNIVSDDKDAKPLSPVHFNITIPDDSINLPFNFTTEKSVEPITRGVKRTSDDNNVLPINFTITKSLDPSNCDGKRIIQPIKRRKVTITLSKYENVNNVQPNYCCKPNLITDLPSTSQIRNETDSTNIVENKLQNIQRNNYYYDSDSSDDDKDKVRTNKRLELERNVDPSMSCLHKKPSTGSQKAPNIQKAAYMWVSVLKGPELPKEVIDGNHGTDYENDMEYQEILEDYLLIEDGINLKKGKSSYKRMLGKRHKNRKFKK